MSKMNESEQLTLLKKIIAPAAVNNILPVDLSRLEKIIKERIPNALEKNAPPNFPELYFDFEYVYSKFYDFLLFNPLIGKAVVALGGGFSSGKSTFLNTILGNAKILPTAIRPSTSVPAYVIKSDNENAEGINTFGAKVPMDFTDIRAIAHGFGETENTDGEITLGHLLRSLFVATPQMPYENIAFLDTPGYSKADSEDYSAKTDEKIAHSQLNASDYILWFMAADAGTISVDDVNFLAKLDKDIPKLIIINKADKAPNMENLSELKEKTRAALDLKGIRYDDVLTYSRKEAVVCDREQVQNYLHGLNAGKNEVDFARNFKKLFVECRNYYDDALHEKQRKLSRVNRAITLNEGNQDINDSLSDVQEDLKVNIQSLTDLRTHLSNIQQEFFTEIKIVADDVNIGMPEPSDIEMIGEKIVSPYDMTIKLMGKNNILLHDDFVYRMEHLIDNIDITLNQINVETESYQSLSEQGQQYKIINHALNGKNIKEDYLVLLASCMAYCQNQTAGILHLYRIANGCNYQEDIRKIQLTAQTLSENRIEDTLSMISDEQLTEAFLIDCVYMSKMLGATDKLVTYIASLFTLLKISNEKIEEGIALVKILIEDDWDKYLHTIGTMQYFKEVEYLGYMVKNDWIIVDNLDVEIPANCSTVVVLNALITVHDRTIELDAFAPHNIVFIGCKFESIFRLTSYQKNVKFVRCEFNGNIKRLESSSWAGESITVYKNEADKKVGITAWIDVENAMCVSCSFKNYSDGLPMLRLKTSTIHDCNFKQCNLYSTKCKYLIRLEDVNITDTIFSDINTHSYLCRNYGNNANGCLCFLLNCTLHNNIFENCVAGVSTYGNRYKSNYPYLLYVSKGTVVSHCQFSNCSTKVHTYGWSLSQYGYIIACMCEKDDPFLKTLEKENTFNNCSCYQSFSNSTTDNVGVALYQIDDNPLPEEIS